MPPRTNQLGLSRNEYKGQPSTLCPGCGHDSISNQIISVCYEMGIEQHRFIKVSGIGCSRQNARLLPGGSHGFNALHGRMPSVVTGALLANKDLECVAISGDGDSGSIGMGQFKHVIRRNVPFVYIIENNGVYGLTKGQFSATADEGQFLKYYGTNDMPPIDLALEAVIAGATFVARSFSGDAKQVQALLQASIRHHGTAVLDIISPVSPSITPRPQPKAIPMAGTTRSPCTRFKSSPRIMWTPRKKSKLAIMTRAMSSKWKCMTAASSSSKNSTTIMTRATAAWRWMCWNNQCASKSSRLGCSIMKSRVPRWRKPSNWWIRHCAPRLQQPSSIATVLGPGHAQPDGQLEKSSETGTRCRYL